MAVKSTEKPTTLYEALLLLETTDECHRFFKDLCTPQEREALKQRWHVCQLLAEGKLSYRAIHVVTGASLATITRVARFFKDETYGGYRKMLERMKVKESK